HLVELRAFLDGVGRRPVALVGVGKDAPLRHQSPHDGVLDEILALIEVVEDLRPQHEVAAVLPLPQVAHRRYLIYQAVVANVHDVVRRLGWDGQQTRNCAAGSESIDDVRQGGVCQDVRVVGHEHRLRLDEATHPAQTLAYRRVQAGVDEGDPPLRNI